MMIHHVKIEPIDVGHYKVFVDNKPMSASKVDVHIDRESIPSVDIDLISEPEIDCDGLVTFSFTPKTVKGAVDLLKAALNRNDLGAFLGVDSLNREIERLGK